jgi:hypothetical protein
MNNSNAWVAAALAASVTMLASVRSANAMEWAVERTGVNASSFAGDFILSTVHPTQATSTYGTSDYVVQVWSPTANAGQGAYVDFSPKMAGHSINVDKNLVPFVVNAKGQVYRLTSGAWTRIGVSTCGGGTTFMARATASDFKFYVASGPEIPGPGLTNTWAINAGTGNSALYRFNAGSNCWGRVDGVLASQVAVTHDGLPVALTTAGVLYTYSGNAWHQYAPEATPFAPISIQGYAAMVPPTTSGARPGPFVYQYNPGPHWDWVSDGSDQSSAWPHTPSAVVSYFNIPSRDPSNDFRYYSQMFLVYDYAARTVYTKLSAD